MLRRTLPRRPTIYEPRIVSSSLVGVAEPGTVVEAAGDVVLRPFFSSDLSDLLKAFADPDIAAWNPGPIAEESSKSDEAVRWMAGRNDWSGGSHVSWAVASPQGQLLGSVSLHKMDHDQSDAEVGYWLAPWARGRGVAVVAVDAAARFGYAELGLHRLHLFHAVENLASCRLATATGFRLEGELRQSYRFADGHYRDEHLHARLTDDPPPLILPR